MKYNLSKNASYNGPCFMWRNYPVHIHIVSVTDTLYGKLSFFEIRTAHLTCVMMHVTSIIKLQIQTVMHGHCSQIGADNFISFNDLGLFT